MKQKIKPAKKDKQLDIIVSVIFVTQNDEKIIINQIKKVNEELKDLHTNYELLIVDNNSQDKTVEKIRTLQKDIPFIRILILSKEYDTDTAFTAGLDNCIGDYAILFNIYTDPPKILSKGIGKLLKNYDIVLGKANKQLIKYGLLSKCFLWALETISTHNFTYRTQYFIGLNRKAINSIIRTRRKSRSFSYINYLIGHKKYIFTYTPVALYSKKIKAENFFSLFFNATDIIISNSYKPMRILSFLGVFTSMSFLLYVVIISIVYFFFDHHIAPQGWISLAFVMGAMFLLLFSLLMLISEYVIRTLHETRNEPLYFISDEIDKSVILTEQDKLNIV